jgi:AraC-like DNA-binding protein
MMRAVSGTMKMQSSKPIKVSALNKIPVRHIGGTSKEPGQPERFIIWDLKDLLSGKDMVQELHRHSFYFILVLKKGLGEHHIDFTAYPIGDHCIFFMRPGQVHKLVLGKDCEGFLLQFPSDFYLQFDKFTHQIVRKVSQKNFYRFDVNTSKKILSILDTIRQEYSSKGERYAYAIQLNLQYFFIQLLRQEKHAIESSKRGTYIQERLEELQELIDRHVSTHKRVSWYAEKLHLTSYQLNIITKTALGKTCSEVIDDYILLEAKRYLLATSNQVNQISGHLGYEDTSYFIRFFKKHTSFSPEAFRNHFA